MAADPCNHSLGVYFAIEEVGDREQHLRSRCILCHDLIKSINIPLHDAEFMGRMMRDLIMYHLS